jgi:hypothetical protein
VSGAASTAATEEAQPASPIDPALRRFLGWAVLLISGGYTFLDYWNYSRTFYEGGGEWEALLAGRSFAPAQYRIGVVRTADLLARLTHTHLRHMFAVIDFVSLEVGLMVLLWLLMRSETFRSANRIAQWLQASLALGCFLLYLLWSFWFQKPETQPTMLLLVLSAAAAAERRRRGLAAVLLIALAAIGATVRADAVIAFHLGFLVAYLLPHRESLPLGRKAQLLASGLSVVAAGYVQAAIMHIYPHAPRQIAAFQLFGNLKTWLNYPLLAAALFPWWITLALAVRRWRALDGWMVGLLLGSVAHFLFYYTFGIAWEVRIFLPFAMTVAPITVMLAYCAIERDAQPGTPRLSNVSR